MGKLVNIKLKFAGSQIKRALQPAIVRELNRIIDRVWFEINEEARSLLEDIIKETPIYGSLIEDTGHSLKAEFGIEDADRKLETIVNTWMEGLRVTLKPIKFGGNRLYGGINIQAIDSSYQDVIYLPEAHHEVERKNKDVTDIKWLEWLLTEGTNPLVFYFYVDDNFDPSKYESRTGLAVMKHNNTEIWRVPEWAAGTPGDNWITKAMVEAAKSIRSLIVARITLESPGNIRLG